MVCSMGLSLGGIGDECEPVIMYAVLSFRDLLGRIDGFTISTMPSSEYVVYMFSQIIWIEAVTNIFV